MATITDMYGQNWALSEGGRQQYAFDLNKWQTDTAGMENPPPRQILTTSSITRSSI